ncbi:MAG: hypothetical protein IKR68_05180 [Lachnospiraceae bacterium]|nr:hypothetical protein [Lachnospiraceae bacterium]
MKKRSRFLAILLSAAMVMTSFSVPAVAAEPTEEIPVEAVEETPLEEDVIEEQTSSLEETVDETVSPTEQDAKQESTDTQVGDPAAGDTFIVVRDMAELEGALAAAKKGVQTMIYADAFNNLENDKGYFTISENSTLEIPSGADIVLNSEDAFWFDNEVTDKLDTDAEKKDKYDLYPRATLKVNSGAKLTLAGGEYGYNIVNEGDLTMAADAVVTPYYGAALTNTGTARISDSYLASGWSESVIVNEGDLVIGDSKVVGKSDATNSKAEKTKCAYTIDNKKNMIVEDIAITTAGFSDTDKKIFNYDIFNEAGADMQIRGDSDLNTVLNKGTLRVGTENDPDETTNVGAVFTVEEGALIQHASYINAVYTAHDQDFTAFAAKTGSFTQVGGTAYHVYYTKDKLPVLEKGYVYGLVVEVLADGTIKADEDVTTLKYMGCKADSKELVEREAFREFDAENDPAAGKKTSNGKDYLVANKIINGIPYYDDENLFEYDQLPAFEENVTLERAKPIASLADFKAAAASETEGYWFITADADFTIEEVISVKNPGFNLVANYKYKDGETVKTSKSALAFKGAGSLNVEEGAVINFTRYNGIAISATELTGSLITNAGTVYTPGITVDKVSKVLIENSGSFNAWSITVTDETADTVIHNAEKGDAHVNTVTAPKAAKAVIVNDKGATANVSYKLDASYSKAEAVTNAGDMTINGVIHTPFEESGNAAKNLVAVNNSGNLTVDGVINEYSEAGTGIANSEEGYVVITGTHGGVYAQGASGIAVDNKGKTELKEGGSLRGLEKNTTCLLNNGSSASFVMSNGEILAYNYDSDSKAFKKESYAIVYTDNEPVLREGVVYGSRGTKNDYLIEYKEDGTIDTDDKGEEKVVARYYGAAVVKKSDKPAEAESGKFVNGTGKCMLSIDSMFAGYIVNGQVPYRTTIDVDEAYYDGDLMTVRQDYLLMEVGESVAAYQDNVLSGDGEQGIFAVRVTGNTFGVKDVKDLFEVVSTNPESVAFEKDVAAATFDSEKYSGDGYKEAKLDVIAAKKAGKATVKVVSKLAETEDYSKSEEYIVIEVVPAGGREKIVADSYEATLVNPSLVVNAYQKDSVNLGIDWHLKDDVTGAYDYSKNFYPTELKIWGSTIQGQIDLEEYFTIADNAFTRNPYTKTYFAPLEVKTEGNSTALAIDQVTSLKDLNVVLIVKNVVSKKTLEIPVKNKLNIAVKQVRPSVKLAPGTVNSAYYDDFVKVDPSKHRTSFGPFTYYYSDNQTVDFVNEGPATSFDSATEIRYDGTSKGGKYRLPIKVTFDGYWGEWDAVMPVTAKPVWPSLKAAKKTYIVAEKAGDYQNFGVGVTSTNEYLFGKIRYVEVLGSTKFEYAGKTGVTVIKNGKKPVYGCNFILRPKADIKGSEKVTLRVHYADLKRKKGKEYTSDVKIKVKSLANGKFKLAGSGKPDPVYAQMVEKNMTDLDTSDPSAKKDEAPAGEVMPRTAKGSWVYWSVNPSDAILTDTYFVVTSLDGKLLVANNWHDDDDNPDTKYNGVVVPGNTDAPRVYVTVGDKLTAKDKKANIQVSWYSSDGKPMCKKPLTISVPITFQGGSVIAKRKEMTIAIDKQKYVDDLGQLIVGGVDVYEYFGKNAGYYAYGSIPCKIKGAMELHGINYNGYENFFKEKAIADGKNLYVFVDPEALEKALVSPGSFYDGISAYFSDPLNGATINFSIRIKDVKKVKATGAVVDDGIDGLEGMSSLTSYARTNIRVETASPEVGLRVKSAKLTGKAAGMFELTHCTAIDHEYDKTENDDYVILDGSKLSDTRNENHDAYAEYYSLTWKDKKLPAKVKKGNMKVTMEITYTCGAKAKVNVTVPVYGAAKKGK